MGVIARCSCLLSNGTKLKKIPPNLHCRVGDCAGVVWLSSQFASKSLFSICFTQSDASEHPTFCVQLMCWLPCAMSVACCPQMAGRTLSDADPPEATKTFLYGPQTRAARSLGACARFMGCIKGQRLCTILPQISNKSNSNFGVSKNFFLSDCAIMLWLQIQDEKK